ncbi:MAG: DUF4864 domain-containing protein [Pseudomonadota bacterium]
MHRFLLAVVMAAVFSTSANAQSTEIEANITAQIEALKVDDFAAAFEFASPQIQQIFRTPENFGAMVQSGYPMVWRPADVRFLELRKIAGAYWQKVMITDGSGRVHILDYQMSQLDNMWKINGVQILDSVGQSA